MCKTVNLTGINCCTASPKDCLLSENLSTTVRIAYVYVIAKDKTLVGFRVFLRPLVLVRSNSDQAKGEFSSPEEMPVFRKKALTTVRANRN